MSQPNLFLFKSLLLEYTQKQRLHKPVYESLKKGPGHEPIFTASVIVKGQKYDSPPSSCSRNVKAAEHAAARVALEELCKEEGNSSAGNYPSAVVSFDFSSFAVNHAVICLNLCAFLPYTFCCHSNWSRGFVKTYFRSNWNNLTCQILIIAGKSQGREMSPHMKLLWRLQGLIMLEILQKLRK